MTSAKSAIPNVLSIAGSDPSGGAGVQADLKTFAALGCHGMAVVASLTAQNSERVGTIHLPPAAFVAEQIGMIFADIDVAAVKIGMLGSEEIVETVVDSLDPVRQRTDPPLPIVVDPVFVASTGSPLGGDEVAVALWEHLLPIATLVTPNLPEVARLAGVSEPRTREEFESAARRLHAAIPCAWLIKGGHAEAETADDLLFDGDPRWLSSPRVATANTHGTGCTLSSAIAAFLAKGAALGEAAAAAKTYLDEALASAHRLDVGRGPGPVDHFTRWR